jgi:hypothetical protein
MNGSTTPHYSSVLFGPVLFGPVLFGPVLFGPVPPKTPAAVRFGQREPPAQRGPPPHRGRQLRTGHPSLAFLSAVALACPSHMDRRRANRAIRPRAPVAEQARLAAKYAAPS